MSKNNGIIRLNAIDNKTRTKTIAVRILRLWVQKDLSGKEGLEMIIIDEWGDKIQASISVGLKKKFLPLLKSHIILIKKFQVLENKPNFQSANLIFNVCKADGVVDMDDDIFSVEYLNTIKCSGLSSHEIILKEGCITILLRNIDPCSELCNGTRMIVTKLGDRIIEAKLISGKNAGKQFPIARMIMSPSDFTKFPIRFQRRQFPLTVCFAMTINKRNEEKKEKEIGPIIEGYYDKYFANTKDWSSADFYHAVCQTIEDINKTLGSTQLRVPKTRTLEDAYKPKRLQTSRAFFELLGLELDKSSVCSNIKKNHHKGKGKLLTKEEFEKILKEVILDTGVTSIGAKDILLYLFGVPATALFLKQKMVPKLIPNEVFIPAITSATVFLLAMFNKI
ncbi:hypothetical protein OROMI_024566 [Orobanche minor]